MSETNKQLHEQIKDLIPINELPENLQEKLLECAQVMAFKESEYIFKQGDKDNYSYYLLEGEIELQADTQSSSMIQSGSDRGKYALAQLQPRQFSAKANTPLKVLLIERNALDQLMLLAEEAVTVSGGISVSGIQADEVGDDDIDWMTQMLQSELFSKIPMANIHQLFALLEPMGYKAGDVVISEGESGKHYYIISEGRCAVSRQLSSKSDDIKLAELKSGDSFGEEALIANEKRNATVTMLTDGVLMRLAKDTFIELIKNPTLQSFDFADAKVLVEQGAKWLDVRFPNEYQNASIKGSINIPLMSLRQQTDKLDPAGNYVLYCDTGARSSTGAFLLTERGYNASFLEGGLVNSPEALSVQKIDLDISVAFAFPETIKDIETKAEAEHESELETDKTVIEVAEADDAEADESEADESEAEVDDAEVETEVDESESGLEAEVETEVDEAEAEVDPDAES